MLACGSKREPMIRPVYLPFSLFLFAALAAWDAAAELIPAPLTEAKIRASQAPQGLIWIEGQDATRSTAQRHNWYDSVRKNELSGGDWLSHFGSQAAEVGYRVEIQKAGPHQFWIRANPVGSPLMEYRLNDQEWQQVDFSNPVQQVNIASDGKADLRFVAWLPQGSLELEPGVHELSFRMNSKNNNHGGIDAVVLSTQPFTPNYGLRPGQTSGLADPEKWAFEPAPDPLEDGALLDLRYLNEIPAGRSGFIRTSEDGESFVSGSGKPIRFWSGTTYVARNGTSVEQIEHWGQFYAKRGVNMVRYHGDVVPPAGEDLSRINEGALDEIWRLVAGMKKAGIYTTVSPYWGSATNYREGSGVSNPQSGNMSGLLFFEPRLQDAYKAWLRALFTRTNPYTGIPLKDDPALALFQIQNEDSLLFFTSQNIKGEALALLRKQYAAWLKDKHGSLEQALAHWDDQKHEHDNIAGDEVGLFIVWHLTQSHKGGMAKRLADQLQFMTETMERFNRMIADFIRNDIGAPQLINAGNWKTADDVKLLDAERWSYTANDVIGSNKYFAVDHNGERAGYAILEGDFYQSRSALLNPLSLPINTKQPAGHPFIISESQWVPPNLYQSEGSLAVAAYQSLTGVDSFYWFAMGGGFQPPFGKWETSTPVQLGMFPAAALIFRNGYIKEGTTVLLEERSLQDVWDRRSSLLIEKPGFDPNRDAGDLPEDNSIQSASDPLAFLVGPVRVRYGGDPASSRAENLEPYIDHPNGIVRSITGEIELHHRDGILTVDTPQAQGAAGFLSKASPIRLKDIEIQVRNPYISIQVVSLDGKNLSESENLLLQAGTTARPYGFEEEPATKDRDGQAVDGNRITQLGTSPWNLDRNDFNLIIRNNILSTAYVLDANGYPVEQIKLERQNGSIHFTFPANCLYVILRR
jgi:hypothetical protein